MKPGIDFLAENRKDEYSTNDSLLNGSLKYYEIDPFIQLIDFKGLNFTAKYSLRNDYVPLNGIMENQAITTSEIYSLNYNGIKEVQTSLNFTYSSKKYTDVFKLTGFGEQRDDPD